MKTKALLTALRSRAYSLAASGKHGFYPFDDTFNDEVEEGFNEDGTSWEAKDGTVVSICNMPVTYHRNPTKAEIAFGYGAIHYRDFEMADVLNEEGRIKKWLVAPDDGLRYYY